MFEYLFTQIYEQRGVRISEEALIYFYYGVVNAIVNASERVKEQPLPIAVETIAKATSNENQLLASSGYTVEKEPPRPWLYKLITAVLNIKKVEYQFQAQQYLNQLIITTSNAVISEAATIAIEKRPQVMIILPEDLEAACFKIFKEKWWFIC